MLWLVYVGVQCTAKFTHVCVVPCVFGFECKNLQKGTARIFCHHQTAGQSQQMGRWAFELKFWKGCSGFSTLSDMQLWEAPTKSPQKCVTLTPKIKRDREESLTLTSIKTRKRRASWTGSQPVDLQQCTDVDWEQKVLITSTNKSSILDVSLPSQKLIGKFQIVDRTEKIPEYSGDSWRLLGKIRRIQM